ncbi:MAG TPA: IS200/IS605 family transposase [Armatimonadota bacterium]|jgi:putative transposase
MDDPLSLNHTQWECKYHVVFIPKCRRKVLWGQIRTALGPVLAELARRNDCVIESGSLQPDHVHLLIRVPPKYAVAQIVGYLKGKSAIYIARTYGGRKRNFTGESFWARGYYVSTVGKDEEVIRNYIRQQGEEDKRLDQLRLDE